jgi:Cu(I)/Ag(I) efflux system membrane fusion protein
MNCCGNSKIIKYTWLILGITLVLALVFSLTSCGTKEISENRTPNTENRIEYYTCGMHPSVRVSPGEYAKGNVNCPICNMKLTPVHREETQQPKGSPRSPATEGSPEQSEGSDARGEVKGAEEVYYGCGVDTEGNCPHCDLGKPDARCICGEHAFTIKGEKIDCPVCRKPLRELTREEVDKIKGVVGRVTIKGKQTALAGVRTEPVTMQHLYKAIRTVGKVAYDPQLAIAQEEFISALHARDKIAEGNIPEIKERTQKLVESSRQKLRLLGLGAIQIKELEDSREVQTNLILPEEKMWVYGDVYEYELSWIKVGEKVNITTASLPGEEFHGAIASVNPVLDPKTRSVTFRAEVENPDLKLKPEMYVDVAVMSMYMSADGEHMVLSVPKSAILDTGTRRIVWVDTGTGTYEGREIIIGPEATAMIEDREVKFYPVLKGLREGEQVVTKANFLIDSQSQISGVAASAYGGALGAEEEGSPKGSPAGLHQH